MAKTLEELAAEKGFIEAEPTQEVTEEITEEEKIIDEFIASNNLELVKLALKNGKDAAELASIQLTTDNQTSKTIESILLLMLAQTIANAEKKDDLVIATAINIAKKKQDALTDASAVIKYLGNNFFGSEDFKSMCEAIEKTLEENKDFIKFTSLTSSKLWLFLPFMIIEYLENLEASNISIEEFLKTKFDENGNPTDSEAEQLLERAKERQAAATTQVAHNKVLSPIVKPLNFNFLNSKIANKYITLQDAVQKLDANGQWYFLPLDAAENYQEVVVRKATKRKKAVISPVSLTYKGQLDAKAAKLTGYDSSIMNAIYTLVMAGNTTFFVDDIYKTMSQKDKATEKQLNKILACMNKVSDHVISINVTEELNENLLNIDNELVTEGILEDNLLHFRKLYLKTEKGKVKTAVEILAEPILLTYSKAKNQILTVPTSLLEMKCRVSEETIPIRDYLLKVIHQFKKGYRDNFTINYDNLLSYIGFDSEIKSRTEKNRITADVITILDGFKEKKEITDYKILNGQRNRITAFEIVPRSTE